MWLLFGIVSKPHSGTWVTLVDFVDPLAWHNALAEARSCMTPMFVLVLIWLWVQFYVARQLTVHFEIPEDIIPFRRP